MSYKLNQIKTTNNVKEDTYKIINKKDFSFYSIVNIYGTTTFDANKSFEESSTLSFKDVIELMRDITRLPNATFSRVNVYTTSHDALFPEKGKGEQYKASNICAVKVNLEKKAISEFDYLVITNNNKNK